MLRGCFLIPLESVVISGGEPTLQEELPEFCRGIQETGYAVKLDTNSSRPRMIQDLIRDSLIDYVAMDTCWIPIFSETMFRHTATQSC